MGEVFVARLRAEQGFERLFAAKRVRHGAKLSPRMQTMFFDEARIAASVHSPFVVPVLDVGRDEHGVPFMIMDLVLGTSVARLRESLGPLALGPSVAIALDATAALADAHGATDTMGRRLAIVHRDVTPNNVLVGLDGRARLTDFGIAKALHTEWQTSGNMIVGTIGYFSPEQTLGSVDQASDVFSLGVVIWELLTDRRLFTGPNPLKVLEAVQSAPIPVPHQLDPRVPAAVSSVVMRALERDRAKRWPSAMAMHQAMHDAFLVTPDHRDELGTMARALSTELLEALSRESARSIPALVEELTTETGSRRRSPEPTSAPRAAAIAAPLEIPPTRRGFTDPPSTSPDGWTSPTANGGSAHAVALDGSAPTTSLDPSPLPPSASDARHVVLRGLALGFVLGALVMIAVLIAKVAGIL